MVNTVKTAILNQINKDHIRRFENFSGSIIYLNNLIKKGIDNYFYTSRSIPSYITKKFK